MVNDFLQLSKIAERLQENDKQAYIAFMTLIENNVKLQEECDERGKRLGRLQKQESLLRKEDKKK